MPNRTMCDVLEDMRECVKALNFSPLLSLITECQIMGNRMESKLYTIKDFEFLEKEIKLLKKKKIELKKETGEEENRWD
jgi:hypothetical protein